MRGSTVNAAPVLLQIPPFHRHVAALAEVGAAWSDIAPPTGHATDRHRHAETLVALRVGGRFWADERTTLSAPSTLVCAPPDPVRAARLWRSARESEPAARLALVLPVLPKGAPTSGFARLARRVRRDGGTVVPADTSPHGLLDHAVRIRIADIDTVSALALLRRLPVWRHQHPGQEPAAEDPARALALLLDATRYRDPFFGQPIPAGEAIALLADWKRIIAANRGIAVCTGMSFWKRRRIAELLVRADRSGAPVFRRTARGAIAAASAPRHPGAVAFWSSRTPAGLLERSDRAGMTLLRVEDGFIRSIGLGSDMLPPASVIVDKHGIYYDPSHPSDLEILLATHPFDSVLQQRARRLIDRLVAGGISKYAAGGQPLVIAETGGRMIVLVPGQVADDLSVRLGGAGITSNLELLRRVRSARPDAYLIYRPHPDVDAGHRPGALPDPVVLALADRISRGGGMAPLIAAVDEVHTLTSLAGFEALLRGRHVVTYGQPFYAGWGLTEDLAPVARRRRTLTIEALAAATLILYPRYIDPRSRLPCGPEVLIDRLGEDDLWAPTPLMRLRRLQGKFRRAVGGWRLGRSPGGQVIKEVGHA